MLPEKSRDSFSPPPIASPHGGKSPHKPPPESFGTHVRVRCTVESAFYSGCVGIFQPIGMIGEIVLTLVLASLFNVAILKALLLIFGFLVVCSIVDDFMSARSYIVQLRPDGVYRRRTYNNELLRWSQFLWIVDLGGNIWMATFFSGCFISRDSFASREQAREFARIVRELRRTKGEAWDAIFGEVSSLEAERNLGKSE